VLSIEKYLPIHSKIPYNVSRRRGHEHKLRKILNSRNLKLR
jgi:hypothetical protein